MESEERLKGIPIGIDDFKDLMQSNGYFVDKSLFIKEIIDDISKVKLITRPRRFGKTLNLSMLRYFFEKTEEDNSHIFKDLKIWQQGEAYTKEQGQYPVVSLTFKDIKYRNANDCLGGLMRALGNEFIKHKYVLECDKIDDFDKKAFITMMNGEADYVNASTSLELLTKMLRQYHNKEVIVLIDEYDTPINQGYICGYYDDVIDFMRSFLGSGLKGNPYLKTAVITGIYRVAKESIFSGFNNIDVSSVMHNTYADKFGFTEGETEDILRYYGVDEDITQVKEWYNGYLFGNDTVIYNPWSILNYIKYKEFQPYWVNTSSNDIIRQVLTKTASGVKEKLRILMEGGVLEDVVIDTDTNFRDIMGKDIIGEGVLWDLLLVSGYLRPQNTRVVEGRTRCELKVPNKEIALLYEDIVSSWFEEAEAAGYGIKELLADLTEGDIDSFAERFKDMVQRCFSYFDVGYNAAENFYHAFILGILVNLEGKYKVVSNRESGKGRPDIMIIPKDASKKGVVLEFKTSRSDEDKALEDKAQQALKQIAAMDYAGELASYGIKEAIELAIVFCGKKVLMRHNVRKLA
jgi:hypothetical protein